MKTLSLCVLFLLACAAPHAPAQNAPSGSLPVAPATLQSARNLAEKGHLDEALEQLDRLAASTPEAAGVERLRGMILYQKEDLAHAIEAFSRAAAQDPSDRESVEMHGVALFRRGQSAEAIPFLEQAHASVASANLDPNYVLGLCYIDVKRMNDARRVFASYYGFAPDSAEAHLLLARMVLRRGHAADAHEETLQAIGLNASLPGAHLLLGEVALAEGDLPTATQAFEAEEKIDPLNGTIYDRLGDALLRSGNNERAQQELNRAIVLEPNATGPYILLGQALLNLKQPVLALHYLNHAVHMDPSNYITHNLLAQAYKATGQLSEANREFKTVATLRAKIAQEER